MKDCSNCSNNTWGNGVGPLQTVCIRCRYVEEDGDKVPSNWNPKPMTNADRIRAMSDEELAKFLECFGLCHHCIEHHRLGDVRIYQDEKCDEMCEQHCLEWLRQPAEEVQSNA